LRLTKNCSRIGCEESYYRHETNEKGDDGCAIIVIKTKDTLVYKENGKQKNMFTVCFYFIIFGHDWLRLKLREIAHKI
jgi:hypothetical protein